jgi:hypothetical protein
MQQAGKSRAGDPMSDEVNEFFNLPNPSSDSRPWVYSASNRDEHKKQKNNVSVE